MRKAFSVIPNDYWQLHCWTCRESGHSTFTCPTLTPTQRMYFAYEYYLDQVRTKPSMETFLAEKTQRRIDLACERREDTGTRTDQRNNVTHDIRTTTTHPKSILTNPIHVSNDHHNVTVIIETTTRIAGAPEDRDVTTITNETGGPTSIEAST